VRQFLRAFEGLPQIVPKSNELPYLMLDFLQFLLKKLAHALARRPTFVSQSENLPNLIQRKPELLRLLDKLQPVDTFGAVDPIACGRPLGGRQKAQSLIEANCLHTHTHYPRHLANERFLFHRENLHPIVNYRVKRFLEAPSEHRQEGSAAPQNTIGGSQHSPGFTLGFRRSS
jgi:hypothetical protein